MRILPILLVGALSLTSACVIPASRIDLEQVASENGLKNVTTGDGDFGNYIATNYSTSTEIGFGMGMPLFKMFEVFPAWSNEDLMGEIAKKTVDSGGNAMINVTPTQEAFYGFIFGVYVDTTSGTGIKTN